MNTEYQTDTQKIDVVIPYHEKDSDIIDLCLASCAKYINNIGRIYIITRQSSLKYERAMTIEEDSFFEDGLTAEYIKMRLGEKRPDLAGRAGWFFQQFIKMGSSYAVANLTENYLALDSDVVFLNKIQFVNDGKMLLAEDQKIHRPYFDCYYKLLGEQPDRTKSFITHHQLINRIVMRELLEKIEKRFRRKWYDAVLDCVVGEQGMLFSEYETYGHYVQSHYPNRIKKWKPLCIQRFRIKKLMYILFNLADYAAIHDYKKPKNNPKTNPVLCNLSFKLIKWKVGTEKLKGK